MFERFYLKSSVILAVLLAVVLAGCATTKSGSSADGPGEVQGSAPTGAEADFYAPPPGPAVLRAKSEEQQADNDVVVEGGEVIRRATLNELIARGPGYVFSQVETKPVHEGKKFVGFELVSMSSAAQHVVESRVRVGDVVTHLNGVQQRSPEDYLKAWKLLGDAKNVQVDLIRDGQLERVIWRVE